MTAEETPPVPQPDPEPQPTPTPSPPYAARSRADPRARTRSVAGPRTDPGAPARSPAHHRISPLRPPPCAVRPPARENGGNEEVTAIDVSRIQEVVQLIEAGDLTQAANRLGPMVSGKRSIRGGRSTPEAEEIDEVKKWLGEVVADPDDPGARFLVERSYYKLRSQLPKDEAQHRVAKK